MLHQFLMTSQSEILLTEALDFLKRVFSSRLIPYLGIMSLIYFMFSEMIILTKCR